MIKLIATDMDGTLLDGDGKLPKDFINILDRLLENDIRFVIASGRSYSSLNKIFKPISDKLQFICDNGAFVVENSKISSIDIIDKEYINDIINKCKDIKNIGITLCGTKGLYQNPCGKRFDDERAKYYSDPIVVEDLCSVEDDIFKIAICDLDISAENSFKVLEPIYGEKFSVVVSGEIWLDIMNKGVNKGVALEKIQRDFNVSYEETMVFGDFYNDIEMLEKAHYSFVMENANEDMKKYGNFTARKNTEYGVIRAIEDYVLEDIS